MFCSFSLTHSEHTRTYVDFPPTFEVSVDCFQLMVRTDNLNVTLDGIFGALDFGAGEKKMAKTKGKD